MSKQSTANITKEAFIELWFRFLQLNTDYMMYCIFRDIDQPEKTDKEELNRYEQEYPKIAQVFDDWGSVLVDDTGFGIVQFRDWFASHRHFFEANEVDSISVIESDQITTSATVISIPHTLSKASALDQIEKQLAEKEKLGFHQMAKGKYELDHSCKATEASYTLLRKILRVAYLKFENEHKPKVSVSNFGLVKQIVLEEEWGWPWRFSDEDKDRMKSDKMKSVEVEDEKRQIKRYKTHAKNIVHNTLHGVFPIKDKLL